MAAPSNSRINVDLFVSFGDPGNDQIVLNISELTPISGNAIVQRALKLTASQTNQSLNLASELSSVQAIVIKDVTASAAGGVLFGADSTGTKFEIAAGRATVLRPKAGSTPPTLYFTNPSSTDDLYLEVIALGSK